MPEPLRLEFGFLAPSFRTQLRKQGWRIRRGCASKVTEYDKDNIALSRLCLREIISARTREEGRQRILRQIVPLVLPPTPRSDP